MMHGLYAVLAVAANAASFSSELESKHDRLVTALIQGESVDTRELAKERKAQMPLTEAWSHVKMDSHLAMMQHEMQDSDSLKINDKTVDMARTRLNDMIHDAYTALDIVVVRCKGDYDVNRKSFSIADGDYIYATAHKKKAEGMVVSSQGKVTGYSGVIDKTQGEIAAATGVFDDKKKALDDVIKATQLKVQAAMIILSVTGSMVKKYPLKAQMKGITPKLRPKRKMMLAEKEHSLVTVCTNKESGEQTYKFNDPRIQKKLDELESESRKYLQDAVAATLDEQQYVEDEEQLNLLQTGATGRKLRVQVPGTAGAAAAATSCCANAGTHSGCPKNHFATKKSDKLYICIACSAKECTEYGKDGAKYKPSKKDLTKWCRWKQGPKFGAQEASMNMCPTGSDAAPEGAETQTAESDPFAGAMVCAPGHLHWGRLHDNMSRTIGVDSDKLIQTKRALAKLTAKHKKYLGIKNGVIGLQKELTGQEEDNQREMETQIGMLEKSAETAADERTKLDHEKEKILKHCKAEIKELMSTTICGQLVVRDEVQNLCKTKCTKDATTGFPLTATDIQDCVVTDKFEQGPCLDAAGKPKPCDDRKRPIGGTRTLTRSVVTKNNDLGFACPTLVFTVPCGKHGCPKDCVVPEFKWGGATCNVTCGKGTKTAVRRASHVPKNGGMPCPSLSSTEACQKGPCNKDCELGEWSKWSPCSASCNGGFRAKMRQIVKQPIGQGKECPARASKARLAIEEKQCNTQKCVGDEICEANMDMVILMDSSGSIGNENFFRMALLVGELVNRFAPRPLKSPGVRVAVVRYGNGFIQEDGTITDAEVLWPRPVDIGFAGEGGPEDFKTLAKKLGDAKHARGFTNLAQGLLKAGEIFSKHSRAPKVNFRKVLILTDGHVAFAEQARVAKHKIEEQGIMINVLNFNKAYAKDMREFASTPRDQNFITEDDFGKLKSAQNRKIVVERIMSNFCPRSKSPSIRRAKVIQRGYKKVRAMTDCPNWWYDISVKAGCPNGKCMENQKAVCSKAAMDLKIKQFTMATCGYYAGKCYARRKKDPKGKCDCQDSWCMPDEKGWSPSGTCWNIYRLMNFESIWKAEPAGGDAPAGGKLDLISSNMGFEEVNVDAGAEEDADANDDEQ